MEVITQPDIIAPGTTVATIGMFDGVHRGHAMLINFLNETARKHKLKSAVITFKNIHNKYYIQTVELKC